MKRWMLAATGAVLMLSVSSCGLFRKSSRAIKVDSVRIEKTVTTGRVVEKVSEEVKKVDQGVTVAHRQTTTTRVVETPGATISATGKPDARGVLLKDSAGYKISALLDSLTGHLTVNVTVPAGKDSSTTVTDETITQANNLTTDSTSGSSRERDSSVVATVDQRVKTSQTEKESKPSFFGTLGMWIGIALVAVAVIWILAKTVFKK